MQRLTRHAEPAGDLGRAASPRPEAHLRATTRPDHRRQTADCLLFPDISPPGPHRPRLRYPCRRSPAKCRSLGSTIDAPRERRERVAWDVPLFTPAGGGERMQHASYLARSARLNRWRLGSRNLSSAPCCGTSLSAPARLGVASLMCQVTLHTGPLPGTVRAVGNSAPVAMTSSIGESSYASRCIADGARVFGERAMGGLRWGQAVPRFEECSRLLARRRPLCRRHGAAAHGVRPCAALALCPCTHHAGSTQPRQRQQPGVLAVLTGADWEASGWGRSAVPRMGSGFATARQACPPAVSRVRRGPGALGRRLRRVCRCLEPGARPRTRPTSVADRLRAAARRSSRPARCLSNPKCPARLGGTPGDDAFFHAEGDAAKAAAAIAGAAHGRSAAGFVINRRSRCGDGTARRDRRL